MSLPSRERGLKSERCQSMSVNVSVAPFAGARIEIDRLEQRTAMQRSLPSRERGLKSVTHTAFNTSDTSLPSRERGLKYHHLANNCDTSQSLPSRECGLKLPTGFTCDKLCIVAPFAGARIEINIPYRLLHNRCVAPFAGVWI